MPTIRGRGFKDGSETVETYKLSDEVYILKASTNNPGYKRGARVRLISGIGGSETPGHSLHPSHTTVCRVDTKEAEFVTVPDYLLSLAK